MTHYTPEFFAQCGPETLRTLHDSLATDAAFYRRHADALAPVSPSWRRNWHGGEP